MTDGRFNVNVIAACIVALAIMGAAATVASGLSSVAYAINNLSTNVYIVGSHH